VGADLTRSLLALGAGRLRGAGVHDARLAQANAHALPFADARFDLDRVQRWIDPSQLRCFLEPELAGGEPTGFEPGLEQETPTAAFVCCSVQATRGA